MKDPDFWSPRRAWKEAGGRRRELEEGDALPFYLNMSPPPNPTGEGWQWKLPTHPSSSKTMERIR